MRLRSGTKNRPHFAHVDDDACSAGETALHRVTIRVLRETIEAAISEGRPYPVMCACSSCLAQREAQLARKGSSLVIDRILEDGIRPDVVIVSPSGKPLVAIEVIVSHMPEARALDLYDRLGLPVIRVWPTWESLPEMRAGLGENLMRSSSRITGCFDVKGCTFPRHTRRGFATCRRCDARARRLSVELTRAECYKCHQAFHVLDLVDCTEDQLFVIAAGCADVGGVAELASTRGVRLEMRLSRTAGGSYLAHVCPSCGALQGDNFLYGGDDLVVDVTQDAWRTTTCENRHLEHVATISWPQGTVVGRPRAFNGLVGERAGLFESAPDEGGLSIIPVDKLNLTGILRLMTDGYEL